MNDPHIQTTDAAVEFLPPTEIPGFSEPADEPGRARPAGDKFVTFFLGGSLFAIPASKVLEVTRPTTITPLPHAPQSLMGIAGVRGEIVAVVDLRTALGAVRPAAASRSKLILLHNDEGRTRLAFLVDAMHEIAVIAPEDIRPAENSMLAGKTVSDVASISLINTELIETLLSAQ